MINNENQRVKEKKHSCCDWQRERIVEQKKIKEKIGRIIYEESIKEFNMQEERDIERKIWCKCMKFTK